MLVKSRQMPTGLLCSDHVPSRELRICAEVGTQQILPSWGRTRNPHHCPVVTSETQSLPDSPPHQHLQETTREATVQNP